MAREYLTDEQVEEEIERLRESPLVKLARRERRLQYKRRQYLYNLRELEQHGRKLQSAGITLEILDGLENETKESGEYV